MIASIPSFSRATVVADAVSDFLSLARYAWDGQFFERKPVAASSSRVWADPIAVNKVDLSIRGSFPAKLVRYVSDVFRGLDSLLYAPVVGEGLDVYFW